MSPGSLELPRTSTRDDPLKYCIASARCGIRWTLLGWTSLGWTSLGAAPASSAPRAVLVLPILPRSSADLRKVLAPLRRAASWQRYAGTVRSKMRVKRGRGGGGGGRGGVLNGLLRLPSTATAAPVLRVNLPHGAETRLHHRPSHADGRDTACEKPRGTPGHACSGFAMEAKGPCGEYGGASLLAATRCSSLQFAAVPCSGAADLADTSIGQWFESPSTSPSLKIFAVTTVPRVLQELHRI